MNRLAILRLTQTCSNILESICNEVEIAGDQMIHELSGPILVLEKYVYSIYLNSKGWTLSRSFESFLSLVESQVNAPFLARYLKRDETSKTLTFCNESMMRALTLFTVSNVSVSPDISKSYSRRMQFKFALLQLSVPIQDFRMPSTTSLKRQLNKR